MENGIARNIFNSYRGQSCNNTTFAWETQELHPSRFCWSNNNHSLDSYPYATTTAPATARVETDEFATHPQGSASPALVFSHHHGNGTTTTTTTTTNQYPLYRRNGSHLHPDPHLVCLRLGKQHHFEDSTSLSGNGFSIGKRGKLAYYNFGGDAVRPSSSRSAAVPRCQVEGCHVALVNVKEYHRRHKVCEKHSKAPNVVVLGLEQRFCQQCSRFHVVSEFDDSKRSCRRRLAGHNQRRRKSSHDSLSISRSCSQDNRNRMTGRFPFLPSPSTGCAFSLLSSGADSWVSPSDLSSRSSAALRELIEENRASILASQLILDRDWHLHLHHHSVEDLGEAQTSSSCVTGQQHHQLPEPHGWGRFPATGSNVTLDLMQASSSAVSMLSGKGEK